MPGSVWIDISGDRDIPGMTYTGSGTSRDGTDLKHHTHKMRGADVWAGRARTVCSAHPHHRSRHALRRADCHRQHSRLLPWALGQGGATTCRGETEHQARCNSKRYPKSDSSAHTHSPSAGLPSYGKARTGG